MDPVGFPLWLRRLLTPGDLLLFSANLSPNGLTRDTPHILPQYDNPPARAWYEGALDALGIPPEAFHLKLAEMLNTRNREVKK